MGSDELLLSRATELADEMLFGRALEVDTDGKFPTEQLDAMAAAGLHGASVNAAPETVTQLIEVLASGCLTTAFVWAQHLGATAAAHHTDRPANRFAADLVAGRLRGGVAFAHMLRPGEPLTTATETDDGWLWDGHAPWVTGWGHIDLVHAAARRGDDIVWALIDAVDSSTLKSGQPPLASVDTSATVELDFDTHSVGRDRITSVEPFATWRARYALGLRNNGSFPLGVAARCCRLLERPSFDARLAATRQALDEASTDELPAARAEAALFAVTVSTALVAATGGRGVTLANHAQRLHREAMFLLVQGQTPAIKAEMLDRLGDR